MRLHNNVVLLPSLRVLNKFLHKENIVDQCILYKNRIAIKHYAIENINVIRIWETKSLFNVWYDDFSNNKFIGAIDYSINDKDIKIEYMNINDGHTGSNYNNILCKDDALELKKSLVFHVKNLAKENDKNKIRIDVHSNLRIYNKYFKNEGFVITDRKCTDNLYWIESELEI